MICEYCGNDESRRGAYRFGKHGLTYYLVCTNCERVIYEGIPSHIPEAQKERFIDRIQKGKR
jgi:hypothetical protein